MTTTGNVAIELTHLAQDFIKERDEARAEALALRKALEEAADAFKRFASIYRPGGELNKVYADEEARCRAALRQNS